MYVTTEISDEACDLAAVAWFRARSSEGIDLRKRFTVRRIRATVPSQLALHDAITAVHKAV